MKVIHNALKISIISLISVLWPNYITAATVTVDKDNIRYTVDDEAMTAEVYGPVSSSTTITNLVIPDFIEYNSTKIPVISIRNYAFSSNKNLKGSLTIGNNVQTIGNNAFFSCSGFTGSLTIDDNVQSIGEGAFHSCSGFTGSLTIGDNVQTIGKSAFYNCYGFTGSLTIGDIVQTIGDYAFYNCSGFTGSLTIGDNVQSIGEGAFQSCSGFTGSLTIGDNVQTIGNYAFYYCSGFTGSLTIGDNVQTIGKRAFSGCSGFTGSLKIGDNIQTIGDFAFSGCSGFTGSMTIPNSVQTIGALAFDRCSGFTGELTIPESVKEIGNGCFAGCNKLTSLVITSSNTVINYQAFATCNGLNSITCLSSTPPRCVYGGNGAYDFIFGGIMYDIPLYVPSESINLYKNATEWKKFKYINPISVEATAISLNKDELNLIIGQEATLIATLTPEDASTEIFWSTDNNVISIDQTGKVTALAVGNATVTATAGDVSATCKVTVNPVMASGVTLNVQDMTLLVGQTDKLTATVTPENTTDKTITWKSDNEAVATVGTDGTVTAVSVGIANITATCGEATATCKVTVKPVLANSVTLNVQELTLLVGQTDKLTTTVTPENTTDKTITWKSDNEAIARISDDGTVTAVSKGNAIITATCGEVSATCKVTVYGADDVTVEPGDGTEDGDEEDTPGNNTENGGSLIGNDLTLRVNQSASIDLVIPEGLSVEPKFAWSLDNGGAEFVTMNVKDNTLSASFKGLKVGNTGYTVSIVGVSGNIEAVKGKIMVIAEIPMTSLELDPASITMAQNALPQIIKPVYTPNNASMPEFNWTSSVPTVATVDQNGEVTPVGQGQTVITATALDGSGLSATSTVTVTAPIDEDFGFDESVMGGVEGVTIYLGDSYTLVPKAHDGYQLPENIVWSSSDDQTVSVDQNGKVTGLALGSATISATATINDKEITATCTVTVIPIKVSTIELSQTTAELRATETLTLTATIEPDNATNKSLQWTTNAPSIATVSQEGVVTAHMVGEANITARALDGSNVSTSCIVKVVPTIATGITVKAEGSTSIKATETVQLTATVTPETTTDKSVTWRSDKPAIAIVNNSGVVTGVAVGEVTITATNSAGQTADIKITVIPTPVETIELNRYSAQIKVQDGFQLTAKILPLTATNKAVSWTSSAPETVSVDAEGNVLALDLGQAVITCEAQDGSGVKAECRITVTTTATQSVSITAESSTTLKATETVQLKATVLPATASDKSVRWQSANPDIASVDNTGLVTATSVGSVQITVTNSGGQTASITITVIPTPVESIKLNKTSATLKATETLALIATVYPETATDKSLEWSSDNESVATVNQNGVVTAIATGEANITVKAKDGSNVSATCKVNVIATEVTSIAITANGATTLKASENVQLTATILPETATDKSVKWSASNPDVADVNENGLVTAYSVGESEITATSSSGLTAQITITVVPTPVASITLNRSSLTMKVSNETKLTATILPETATDKTVTWSSSNLEVVVVDSDGIVKALLEGQAAITCTANDGSGISATCIVNVVDTDVETVTVTAEGSTTLKVTETVQLTATVLPETSTDKNITWSSANEGVATVDANGLVTAVSEGVAVIKATTTNGLSDAITITVVETLVTSITLNETSIILQANEYYSLIPIIYPNTATNKQIIWSTGNADVAFVSQDGMVTAVAVGETTITATAADGSGVYASCKVTVIPTPATSITITAHGSTTLEINQTVQLTAEVLPENATDKTVVWSSSNSSVANITETGLVTALTPGETVITATNSAGQYDRVTITVFEPEQPDVPEPENPYGVAATPDQLLRKGDGTSCTFIVMMPLSNEELSALGYKYVYGFDTPSGASQAIDDLALRYCHTTPEIYNNSENDFWVFAYYTDAEGKLCVSPRRHLDGSIDNDFDPADFIGSVTRSEITETITGIYTYDGRFVGTELDSLEPGVYVVTTTCGTYKFIK